MTAAVATSDGLIGRLYDAAEPGGSFGTVLEDVAAGFRSDKAHLFLVDSEGVPSDGWFVGSDPKAISDYHQHFQAQDPRLEVALRAPNRAHSDQEVIDPGQFERSEIYNELLRPHDVRYTLFANYDVEPGTMAAQAFMRSASVGPYEGEEVRQFEALFPHLRRALRLRKVLARVEGQLSDLRRALDLLPMPLAMLEPCGRVVCANEAAERLLNGHNGLMVRQQRLGAVAPQQARAIAAALLECGQWAEGGAVRSREAPAAPGVVGIPRPDGRELSLIFMPLRPRHAIRQDAGAARVLVVFHDPSAIVRLNPSLVARIHGLTPTEALLATSLAQGETLGEFAAARGCTEQTARTHLKRVLDKTQTRRQADLVRLLVGSAAMHLSPGG